MSRSLPTNDGLTRKAGILIRRAGILMVVFMSLAARFPAEARPAGRKEAEKLAAKAMEHFKAGRYNEAAKAYSRAYQVDPEEKYRYNIGLCLFQAGSYDRALNHFLYFIMHADKKRYTAYRAAAARRIQLIYKTTTLLYIVAPQEGAEVRVDGKTLPASSIPHVLRLINGRHLIEARRSGCDPLVRHIMVGPGHATRIELRLECAFVPSARSGSAPGRHSRRDRRWLWMTVAGGAAMLAFEAVAWGLWGAYKGGDDTRAKWPGYLYYTSHGLSAGACGVAVAGLILYYSKKGSERPSVGRAQPFLVPTVSVNPKGHTTIGVAGRF